MVATKPIKDYIVNQLLQRRDLQLDDETPLIDDGYLTSLQTVELVMFLEEHSTQMWGFPGGSGVKNPPANARDMGLIP